MKDLYKLAKDDGKTEHSASATAHLADTRAADGDLEIGARQPNGEKTSQRLFNAEFERKCRSASLCIFSLEIQSAEAAFVFAGASALTSGTSTRCSEMNHT